MSDRCPCGMSLILRPVPGALNYPRRLECPTCGYPKESAHQTIPEKSEIEKRNTIRENLVDTDWYDERDIDIDHY